MKKVTKTNTDHQVNGVWTTDYNDVSLLIARADSANANYENVLTRAMAPHKKKMERGKSLDNATAKRIMIKVVSETILLGWNRKGHTGEMVLEDDGTPSPYSVENAVELLNIDPDLRKFVDEYSTDIENYLDVEETAKK